MMQGFKKYFLGLFLFLGIVFSKNIAGQNLGSDNKVFDFDNISMRNGLSNSEVRSICQDSLGFIWIGTDRGLNRYDGSRLEAFSSFSNKQQISYNAIWGLHALPGGVVIESRNEVFYYNQFTEDLKLIVDNSPLNNYHNSCVWQGKLYTVMGNGVLQSLDEVELKFNKVPNFSDDLNITNIYADSTNGLWCVNENADELYLFNPLTGELEIHDNYKNSRLTRDAFTQDIKQINGQLWIGTARGLVIYGIRSNISKNISEYKNLLQAIGNADIRFIEIKDEEIWIGTYKKGLYIYDTKSNSIENIVEDKTQSGLRTNNLTSAIIDRDNNFWIGTFNKGIQVNYNKRKRFNTNKYINALTRDGFVNCVLADKQNKYYFGTRYQGIITFDSKTLKSRNFSSSNSSLSSDHITSMFLDSQEKLWIGQVNALQILDTKTGRFTSVELPVNYSEVVSINEFNGKIYTCGIRQVTVFDLKGKLESELNEFGTNIRQTLKISDSELLVCGHGSLQNQFRLKVYIPEEDSIQNIDTDSTHPAWNDQYFITTFIDSDGILWIGSFFWGLLRYDFEDKTLKVYSKDDGLPSNDVIGITEDENKNLWLSTYYGLSSFDKKETFTNYYIDEGLNNQQFHQKAVYKHTDGTIFFGGYSGITYFKPKEILSGSKSVPETMLKSLNVNYEIVYPSDDHNVLDRALPYTSSISLSHRQRSFSIDYVAFNYGLAHKIQYAYLLEGYDDKWREVGDATQAVFSNLRPGNYTFNVKSRNSESGWSNIESLNIKVKQTPWLSNWAIILYSLFVISIIVSAFWLTLRAKLYRKDLEVEHSERLREQDVHQMKLKFFTNISHEIRTPLTVISAMVYMLFRQLKPTETTKPLFDSLRLNVDRLLRLINQLLLFREMENDALKLNLSEMKISDILNETYIAFLHFADTKKIRFIINHGESINERSLFYDYDKVEKILANLISNALKNTPQKGEIKLVACELTKMDALAAYKDLQTSDLPISEEGYVEISVMDTGKGIEENELEYIFNRYRKSDNAETKSDYSGSGIGLDFTKRLINLHKGDIIVKSRLNHGTTFSFILPLDSTIYSGENKVEFVQDTQSFVVSHPEDFSESPDSPKVESGEGNFKIAVIEDNVELCDLIVNILKPNYSVISAYNGIDGFDLIEAEIPDLIISDVMMPGMDGLTLCGKIKDNQLLNHIYLILLSAKSEARDQIQGMEKGADMYINKPFNVDYLLAVVDAHFKRRERLNSDFKKGIAPHIEKGQENPEYLDFIDKLHVVLEQELNNETLNVQLLAERMNMSRSNYYRKFESVTGISPNSYIVKFRINKASELMKESEYSVSDISYMVGFPNSAYFSTIFKKENGVSPSQYIKDLYR